MPRSKSPQKKVKARPQATPSAPPTVSARWLLTALAISLPGAALCTWAVFCLLFWQGSWQLLYHPSANISSTPSSTGLAYDQVSFAATEEGTPQLQGWWIPAASADYTALYLHGEKGNLGDTVKALASLHQAGLNVLAFDYRGYGQSVFKHPSEANWRQDAEWALEYLTGTRHVHPQSIVVVGSGLGADLALEIAARHPELHAVVLDAPVDAPASVIFNDPRAGLVPAHLLVRDRYDLDGPAAKLRIPSLWLIDARAPSGEANSAFGKVNAPKKRVLVKTDQLDSQPLKDWLGGMDLGASAAGK